MNALGPLPTLALDGDRAGAPATVPIVLKLFATLARFMPEGSARNEIRIAVPEGTTPADIIRVLNLPVALCALVLIDGIFIEPEARATRVLKAEERFAIWPPVAGG